MRFGTVVKNYSLLIITIPTLFPTEQPGAIFE